MKLIKLTHFIVGRVQLLSKAVEKILPDARRALGKPVLAGHILLTDHRSQFTLASLLIFLIFIAPVIVGFVSSKLFPPEISSKLLGLVKTQQENPLKNFTDLFVMTMLWIVSTGYSLLRFWFKIPEGLFRANAHSRRLLIDGDNCTEDTKRQTLYKRALSIATDPKLESELESRLKEEKISTTSSSSCGDTKILSPQDTMIDSGPSQPTEQNQESQSHKGLDGRYTLGPELGKGAMGVVYQAWDNVLDREVALKQLSLVLAGDDEYASRFRREAKALARLTHPNVVQVFDLIEDNGRLWMVLEFVDGGDLAKHLKTAGNLSAREAVSIIIPVAQGLAYAHNHGIIHRDLKPSNILLGRNLAPKISDFGIAKLTQSSSLTEIGAVLGSPPYMSPEQCSGGSMDARTDIYSLGITLYKLLTGKVPFEGDTASVLARQIVEQPIRLSEVLGEIPEDLEELVDRMLAKSPDQRPADMTEVIDLLSLLKYEKILEKRA